MQMERGMEKETHREMQGERDRERCEEKSNSGKRLQMERDAERGIADT